MYMSLSYRVFHIILKCYGLLDLGPLFGPITSTSSSLPTNSMSATVLHAHDMTFYNLTISLACVPGIWVQGALKCIAILHVIPVLPNWAIEWLHIFRHVVAWVLVIIGPLCARVMLAVRSEIPKFRVPMCLDNLYCFFTICTASSRIPENQFPNQRHAWETPRWVVRPAVVVSDLELFVKVPTWLLSGSPSSCKLWHLQDKSSHPLAKGALVRSKQGTSHWGALSHVGHHIVMACRFMSMRCVWVCQG